MSDGTERRDGADAVPGEVVTEDRLEASGYGSYTVAEDEVMRIIDTEGQQVADFMCFDEDHTDRYSPAHTKQLNRKPTFGTGDVLYSRECRPMFLIRDDTVGRHWSGNITCSEARNYVRYGVHSTRNCRTNFVNAAEGTDLDKPAVGACVAVFMNVTYNVDGVRINREPVSEAGDYIDLQALMDSDVLVSNCPSRRNPCNAYNPTSMRVIVYEPDERTKEVPAGGD